ncbi:MAG: Porin precursor [Candidatus Eremiobacteraeota bacterium]|nr:Porin precursor [Candidatus Eremiobacteraeota bacterium]
MKKLIALAFAFVLATTTIASADPATDAKLQAMQAQLDAVMAQLAALKAQQAAAAAAAAAKPAAPVVPVPPKAPDASFIQLVKGDTVTLLIGGEPVTLYGNLDLSWDHVTKGFNSAPLNTDAVGNTSYLSAISSNQSYFGVRGLHRTGKKSGVLYQLETELSVSSTSGTVNTNSNNDGIVKGGLTSRNSFLGVLTPSGAFKIGKSDAPYKIATARMNPFLGELGDYAVVMGNTGGDNRVEFGTRLDHALWYESPNMHGVTLNVLVSPGQNRAFDNSNIPSGEAGCAGGNLPGSGALPPACNDGSWGAIYSGSLNYQAKKLYFTTAYELHKQVNRSSDIADPVLAALDVGDEEAWKFGAQYAFSKNTLLSAIYENMHRYVPAAIQYQNERTRDGFWLALTQNLNEKNNVNFGWARANPSPGDPGQHNTSGGFSPDNMANLYTFAFKHAIDRHVLWYFDWALTLNHRDAHYDLGAGGRGLTTDCHDASTLAAFDPTANGGAGGVTGNGPHCYAGGRLQGFSTGLDLRF